MKGGIAAALAAVGGMNLKKLKKNLEMVFTYDEEKDFEGIKSVVAKRDLEADCILIGEPTDLKPVVATKGILSFKIQFIGKEAHSSNPALEINAIEMANDFIYELKKSFELLTQVRNDIFENPRASLNIEKIGGDDAANKMPAFCFLEFESRIINNKQAVDLKNVFKT